MKIVFAGLVFAVFAAVALSANSANAGFWDWFRGGNDSTAAVAKSKTYTLKTNKSGFGAVTSNDGKINCGLDCSEKYNSNPITTVILTATPQDGSSFFGWSGGGCKGTGICTVTMTKSTTVTAKFKKNGGKKSDGATTSTVTDGGATTSTVTDGSTSTATNGGATTSIATDGGTTSSAYAGDRPGTAKSKKGDSSSSSKSSLKTI